MPQHLSEFRTTEEELGHSRLELVAGEDGHGSDCQGPKWVAQRTAVLGEVAVILRIILRKEIA